MMCSLSILFGIVIGLFLGLTGGGGSIFAVPLLVYGLSIPVRDAVGISLAAVGATSLIGCLTRLRAKEVEVRTGLIFAGAGMMGAPVGLWLSGFLSDTVLMILFAGLMITMAVRMWQQASRQSSTIPCSIPEETDAPTCRRDASGALILTSKCAMLLMVVGLLTGILSGMFGVGGGFVIVPALVLFSGMSMYRAIGTSLMVITLVSITGVVSHLLAGRDIQPITTGLFIVGGSAGLTIGNFFARRLSGPVLQRVFVIGILAVAAFILIRSLSKF